MSKLIFLCFLLLAGITAWADDAPKQEPACRREAGRVSCSEEGFKTLMDTVVEYRGAADKCQLRHQACLTTREATEGALAGCEAARTMAEGKVAAIKPASPLRPVLALTGAVLGAAALTAGLLLDVPPQARLALGAGGLGAVAVGFVFVLPDVQEK